MNHHLMNCSIDLSQTFPANLMILCDAAYMEYGI